MQTTRQFLVHGGPILTMDPDRPLVDAVLMQFGRIVASGTLDEVTTFCAGPVEELDLKGRLATPGLNDAHAHIMMTGFAQSEIPLAAPAVSSIAQITSLVAERAAATADGDWIIGQGYDQATLDEGRHPTRYDLDAVAPHQPVLLWRSCHHIAVANSRALELAGIIAGTPDPDDGTIDRDERGEPTGVLRESVTGLVTDVRPAPSDLDLAEALRLGGLEFRRNGFTSATEAGIRLPEQLRAYQRLWRAGDLPLRTYLMMIIDDTLDELAALGIQTGLGDDWLTIGPAKLFSDGSIGGRTARTRAPYEGDPDNYGIWMISPEKIEQRVIRAHNAGFQVGIHAIGDAAIEAVLDAYAAAQAQNPRADARHRIEHCSLLDEGLLDRIQQQGVVPIPGTTFLHYMRPVYLQNLGAERVRYAYAMKTFAERGIVAAASSDAPVVPVNPLLGIQTMVTRKDRLGDEIFPEESISIEDALHAYTWAPAFASFSDQRKGTLKAGYLADLTVFGSDLRDVAGDDLSTQLVDFTIADGQVVYERTLSNPR
ncbi:MAG: amidohydrolase [Chloroflexia bacterium]|nr:amidohydrolase [Chloroflexia bacterium]